MEDFNLHLTGDVHAIGAAHNLGARVHRQPHPPRQRRSASTPHGVLWPRVVDISDRALRNVVIGLGGRDNGYPRETEFVITVASEVMAILALATRSDRPSRAPRPDGPRHHARTGTPVTAEDLKVAGAMTVLLTRRDQAEPAADPRGRPRVRPLRAVRQHRPRQQLDHRRPRSRSPRTTSCAPRPASGPTWAPRSSSTSSAARPASRPTRRSWSPPSARSRCTAGSARSWPASRSIRRSSRRTWTRSRRGGAEPRQADRERPLLRRPGRRGDQRLPDRHRRPRSRRSARSRSRPGHATRSSPPTSPTAAPGPTDLAAAVWAAAEEGAPNFELLYPDEMPLMDKIETIATKIYGADGVDYLPAARKQLSPVRGRSASATCPICMAKTQYSLSARRGAQGPPDRLPRSRSARSACRPAPGSSPRSAGEMRTMPGLPVPAGRREHRSSTPTANIVGLF